MRTTFLSGLGGLAACALLIFAPPIDEADGATFPNLYRVTVSPDPAAADTRAAAMEAALARLLIRVTGNRNAPLDPALQDMLANPDRYLNSYGLDRDGQVQVGFIPRLVEQSLTALQLPVWGPERPLTLVWIAIDDGLGGRALIGANDVTDVGGELGAEMAALIESVRLELAAVADERGLPITLPLLDLEDLGAVTFADVWGGFEDRVVAASARYGADAVLIGRVRPGFFGNEAQWLLVKDGARRSIGGVALRDGLDAVADLYAAELSTVGGAATALITIRGVETSADYGRVMSYLEQQSVLQSVDVESLERGELRLRVAARGDARVLERVLALGNVLEQEQAPGIEGGLVFRVARAGRVP